MSKVRPPFYVEDIFKGTTFGDFNEFPQYGIAEHRSDISLQTKFSANLTLNLPVVSANMDTVSGPDMCIAMAQEGGIGILPRSDHISIEMQASWVRKVKRAENFIIENPYTILENATVGQARREMELRKVGTLLAVDSSGRFSGVLEDRYIRLCIATELVEDRMAKVMGGGVRGSRKSFSTWQEAREELNSRGIDKLVLINKDGKIRGLVTGHDLEKLDKYPLANKDDKGQLRVGAAIGATGDYLERACALIEDGTDVIVMDVAHAHNAVIKKAVESFQKKFGNFELVCGNIATYQAAEFMQDLRVSGVKVGIGSGYGCWTRIKTSFGVPQVQAVRAVFRATALPIISDGGIRQNGHIAMALMLGASSVMLGSLLAGTIETPGEVISDPSGESYKIYRGMTSPEAKLDQTGSSARIKNVEGQSRRVPYKGKSVKAILTEIREDLQSAVSYAGEKTLAEAIKKISHDPESYFIRLSQVSQEESYNRRPK